MTYSLIAREENPTRERKVENDFHEDRIERDQQERKYQQYLKMSEEEKAEYNKRLGIANSQ